MKITSFTKLLASLSFFACTSLFAAPLTVDVTNVESRGLLGTPGNVVMTFDVGANSIITSLDYTVNLTAYSPSWLSELGLAFSDSRIIQGVLLPPGGAYDIAGSGTFTDTLDLVAEGLSFAVGADGILRLEFFEYFDDRSVAVDGRWNFGTFTFGVQTVDVEVPEPATGLLLGAGLALMGYAGRRTAGKAAA